MPSDTIRPRLQLSLGAAALLGDEFPSLGGKRLFAATCRDNGAALQVTLHPLPPEGPYPGLMHERVARLKAVTHPGLAMPVAVGELEGRSWVAEPLLTTPTALQCLSDGGAMSVRRGILALRDVTRALASLHRAGLSHGALDLKSIHIGSDGTARLTGFGALVSGNIRGDLDALGPIAWALFTGDLPDAVVPRLGTLRRGVPEGLDALVASLVATEIGRRPTRAEAVLEALDAFPAPEPTPIASFLEGAGRGTRSPRARETLFLTLFFGLTLLVAALIFGR